MGVLSTLAEPFPVGGRYLRKGEGSGSSTTVGQAVATRGLGWTCHICPRRPFQCPTSWWVLRATALPPSRLPATITGLTLRYIVRSSTSTTTTTCTSRQDRNYSIYFVCRLQLHSHSWHSHSHSHSHSPAPDIGPCLRTYGEGEVRAQRTQPTHRCGSGLRAQGSVRAYYYHRARRLRVSRVQIITVSLGSHRVKLRPGR